VKETRIRISSLFLFLHNSSSSSNCYPAYLSRGTRDERSDDYRIDITLMPAALLRKTSLKMKRKKMMHGMMILMYWKTKSQNVACK
jgi:hypothetical protein